MSAIADMIGALSEVCAGLHDQRRGPRRDGDYTMADIGLAAFSIFFMGSPSFLGHQQALAEGHGRSNCETLFGMSAIPSDNYIRLMLDGASPAAFDGLFVKAIEAAGPLTPFQCLDGRVPIALDGSEHVCSARSNASSVRHGGAPMAAPNTSTPSWVPAWSHRAKAGPAPAAGIYRAARWGGEAGLRAQCRETVAGPARRRPRSPPACLSRRRTVCLPADRCRHPDAGGNFILTCKPASHKTIAEYLQGAELQEHRQTICKRGKRTTTTYRWLNAVPLRATDDAILVNWFSIETFNAKGKRTYYNSFVTDLAITRDTVAELAACGRARWKIENETFNVLKTNGYNLEHNFGHGKKTLASILVTLNLLAFAFHTAAYLGVLAWRAAIIARGPMYRFFEHLRTVTAYVVFQDWPHLLQSIAAAAIRPP